MFKSIVYYTKYLSTLLRLGFIDFVINRNKFKKFTSAVIDYHTYYDLEHESEYLKCIELREILCGEGDSDRITIENYNYKQGNVSLYELYCISSIAKHFQPEIIFEIGTFDGGTTLHLALNSPPGSKVYTLDLPPDNIDNTKYNVDAGDFQLIDKKGFRTGEKFLNKPEASNISQLYSDSAAFDFSPFMKKVDLFFIDGAHSIDYVRADTENAFKCLSDKGMILWHDYGNVIDVVRYLNELSQSVSLFRIKHTSLVFFFKKEHLI